MRVQLRWTNQARSELKDIYKWIAQDRPLAAKRMYQRLKDRVLVLRAHPFLGEDRSDIDQGIRVLVEQPYMIFYRTIADAETGAVRSVEILRVLHGSMDLSNRL